MKLSVKSDYAARAVLGLARHHQSPVARRVEELAEEQGVPPNYLLQILLELKAQGIVRSVRGKEGGYLLARAPGQITLGDVLRSVHGAVFDSPALDKAGSGCPEELHRAWQRLQQTLDRAADAINFQQLLDERSAKENAYSI